MNKQMNCPVCLKELKPVELLELVGNQEFTNWGIIHWAGPVRERSLPGALLCFKYGYILSSIESIAKGWIQP